MASIDTGARGGSRKSLDSSIPLIPIIDLLLCCIMFLLVTAVWNALASVDVSQRVPGNPTADQVADERLQLMLLVTTKSYELSTSAGDRIVIPAHGDQHDVPTLHEKLVLYRNAHPSLSTLAVTAEDGVVFESLVAAVDAAKADGFANIAL